MLSKASTPIRSGLGILSLVLLQATAAHAQTEIRQNFAFEGPPGTIVPGAPPVTNCQVTPDFGPAHGTTVQPFTGSSYVGFHEQFRHDFGPWIPNEIFSIELDRTLTSGTAYTYRLMARIAPLGPAGNMNANNFGGNSGSFDIYVGATPCATTQLVGTVSLNWPVDDAWSLRTLPFTANASHRYFTYVAAAQTDPTNGTYFGLDDPRMDYSDAPDTYGTTLLTDGARHALTIYDPLTQTAPLMLGSGVDAEGDGEPEPDAAADQLDDGLQSITLVATTTTAEAVVLATNATATDATLASWVDFDLSGTFDPAERASVIVPANTVTPTPFIVNWAGLAPIPVGFNSFARFRIATDAAEVATSTGTATTGEVEDHRVPIITPPIELSITKVSSPNPAIPGAPLTYTIVATNNGPLPVVDAQVLDAVPAPLAAFTWTCAQPTGSCSVPNGAGTIDTLVDLAAGEQATITLTGTLAPDYVTEITNVARLIPPPNTLTVCPITHPQYPLCTQAPDRNIPRPRVELVITKVPSAPTATLGGPLTYTVTVVNNGPSTATNARIQDAVPAPLSAFTWTCVQAGGACSPAAGTGAIDTLVTLAPGAQAAITLTGTLPADTPSGPLANTAVVVPPPDATPTCPAGNPTCDRTTVIVEITPEFDIDVTKVVDDPAPTLQQRVTFTISAHNAGPSNAPAVTLQEVMPEGLVLVAATPSAGTFDAATGTWQVGALAVDATATLRVVAIVARTGTLTNTATLTSEDDGDPLNNEDTETVSADGTDLEATRVWWLYNHDQETLDFYVDITNLGSRPTSGAITVMVPLPAGVQFHMGPGDWSCEVVGQTNTLSCTRADLVLQSGEQLTLPLWTKGTVPTSATVYAHVTYAPDVNMENNVAFLFPCCDGIEQFVEPSVAPVPTVPAVAPVTATNLAALPETEMIELAITQSAPTLTTVGTTRQFAYTVRVENPGPREALGLTLTDALPIGATIVSATPAAGAAAGGTCAIGAQAAVCQWPVLTPGEAAEVAVTLASVHVGLVTHTVSTSATDPEGQLTNNQVALTTDVPADPALDGDLDGLPTAWEQTMGLDPAAADGSADPDGDGVSNLDEYLRGTHPRGFFRRYFAEGVSNGFFTTSFAVVNPDPAKAVTVVLTAQREDGHTSSQTRTLGPLTRYQANGTDVVAGGGSFSTVLEADAPVAADRVILWDGQRYGSSAEVALTAPSTTWYFAEGATHGFALYYLLQNPDPTQTAAVEVSYLRPAGAPIVKTYQVAPHSRLTIAVHEMPELAATDVSASIVSTNNVPIVAERSMYRDVADQAFGAGHASAGATTPGPSWFFAEGATGSFFDFYLLIANPGTAAAQVTARYQLPDGPSVMKTYEVAGLSRRTISVEGEDARLAATAVAVTLTSTQPIVAERAMWWPGPDVSPEWYEAHDSLGATETGTRWAVAGGTVGGTDAEQTFILIANQAETAGTALLTVVFEDGTRAEKAFPLPPTSRLTVDVATEFPDTAGRGFSVIVESQGTTPVPLVVEWARYGSPQGVLWGAGGAALATKLP